MTTLEIRRATDGHVVASVPYAAERDRVYPQLVWPRKTPRRPPVLRWLVCAVVALGICLIGGIVI